MANPESPSAHTPLVALSLSTHLSSPGQVLAAMELQRTVQADIVRIVDIHGRNVDTLRIWHDTVAYITRGCGSGESSAA